jgi:hypothetical protein
MKWIAVGLGAATLAVLVGATALITQGRGQNTREIVPAKASTPIGATSPVPPAKPVSVVPAVKKPAPRPAQPTRAATCGSDSSDPTGADCGAGQNDNQAGDNQAGDSRDDQGGEPDENDNGD